MPIEIRELVIRTTVVNKESSQHAEVVDHGALKKEIMEACVHEIRRQIVRKKQR